MQTSELAKRDESPKGQILAHVVDFFEAGPVAKIDLMQAGHAGMSRVRSWSAAEFTNKNPEEITEAVIVPRVMMDARCFRHSGRVQYVLFFFREGSREPDARCMFDVEPPADSRAAVAQDYLGSERGAFGTMHAAMQASVQIALEACSRLATHNMSRERALEDALAASMARETEQSDARAQVIEAFEKLTQMNFEWDLEREKQMQLRKIQEKIADQVVPMIPVLGAQLFSKFVPPQAPNAPNAPNGERFLAEVQIKELLARVMGDTSRAMSFLGTLIDAERCALAEFDQCRETDPAKAESLILVFLKSLASDTTCARIDKVLSVMTEEERAVFKSIAMAYEAKHV